MAYKLCLFTLYKQQSLHFSNYLVIVIVWIYLVLHVAAPFLWKIYLADTSRTASVWVPNRSTRLWVHAYQLLLLLAVTKVIFSSVSVLPYNCQYPPPFAFFSSRRRNAYLSQLSNCLFYMQSTSRPKVRFFVFFSNVDRLGSRDSVFRFRLQFLLLFGGQNFQKCCSAEAAGTQPRALSVPANAILRFPSFFCKSGRDVMLAWFSPF